MDELDIHSCTKCYHVFKNKRSLSIHEKSCLKINKGESFLKYDVIQPYDKDDKILPLSQPMSPLSSQIEPDNKNHDEHISDELSKLEYHVTSNELTDEKDAQQSRSSNQISPKTTKKDISTKILVIEKEKFLGESASKKQIENTNEKNHVERKVTYPDCKNIFKNNRGLSQHSRSCKKKNENVNNYQKLSNNISASLAACHDGIYQHTPGNTEYVDHQSRSNSSEEKEDASCLICKEDVGDSKEGVICENCFACAHKTCLHFR